MNLRESICLISTLFICLTFTNCKSHKNTDDNKFDSKEWKIIERRLSDQQYRNKMLTDLIHNVLTFEIFEKGTHKNKVIELIGEPDFIDKCNNYEKYIVEEKYGLIDPNGYVYLNLTYNTNLRLSSWEIEETTFRE